MLLGSFTGTYNSTVMRSHKPYSYTSITFFIISISIHAQSRSISDDRKRFLLEEIKPPLTTTNPALKQYKSENKSIANDQLLGISRDYKSGGAEFESKYDTKVLESTMKMIDILKNDSCTQTKTVFDGGKARQIVVKESDHQLDKLSQRHRMQGLMLNATLGGFNLSGWEKKKLSNKSKAILQNIYGIEITEE